MGIDLYDKNILVTGGSGLLGMELKNTIPNGFFPTHKEFDIVKTRVVDMALYLRKNDIHLVIHGAAIVNSKIDMKSKESRNVAYTTNVVGTAALTDACVRAKVGMYYISTDYVFDGLEPPYCEGDTPNPQNFYAMTKLMGEMAVSLARGYIIRTSFCEKVWPHPGAYTNVVSSRDRVDIIADLVTQCIERSDRWHGTLHVGTPGKTFYELAHRINKDSEVKPLFTNVDRDTSFDLVAMDKILED